MQKRSLVLTALLISFMCLLAGAQTNYTINDSWYFVKDSTIKVVDALIPSLKNAEKINLPHTWNVDDIVDEDEGFYRGIAWYAKQVQIPSNCSGKDVLLYFEGIGQVAEVYINKTLAKEHVGGYTRFVVPVNKFIEFDTKNEFTYFDVYVKADNSYNKNVPTLSADFTFFGGIYRDVNLVVKDKVHFDV